MSTKPGARSSPSSIRCSAASCSWAPPPSSSRHGCIGFCTGCMPTSRTSSTAHPGYSVRDDLDFADLAGLVEKDIERVVVHARSAPHAEIVGKQAVVGG